MRTAIYISDNGDIACFVNRPPYMCDKVVSELTATAQSEQTPRQDGQITYGVNLNAANIVLKGYVHSVGNSRLSVKTVLDEHKAFLNTVFNPKVFGTLIYNNERGAQLIRVRPTLSPSFGDTLNFQNVSIDVELQADDSTWNSYKLYEYALGTVTKLWKFPFTLTDNFKFGEYITEVIINNTSSMTIEPYIEVYSTAEYIEISNETTGDFIKIDHEILDNQKMVIDTKTATVKLYENDVFVDDVSNWVTLDSDFITLTPGKNAIKISNESQNSTVNAKLFYRLPVVGV